MIDLLGAQPKPSGIASSFIKDTDEIHFEQDVLQASMEKPVIVHFWSPGSATCKQLMTQLEKLVTGAAGAVMLAKVNVNKSPGLAQALRIQSVPTVYAFFQGKPVDGFAGSKPEAELRALVDGLKKLAGGGAADDKAAIAEHVKKFMAEADDFFKQGSLNEAMERYSGALELDQDNMEALGGIGWCLLSQGDAADAKASDINSGSGAAVVREMLGQLSPEQLKAPRLQGLQYILSLGDEAGDIPGLIDRLVAEIKKNREGEAKAKLLKIFEALGNAHPLTAPGRRKLSTVLFS
jgi:putative thioredoxin